LCSASSRIAEETAMHARVQRLHAAVHDLRKRCQLRNVAHRDAASAAIAFAVPPVGHDLDACLGERAHEVGEAGLVGD
jgi:hypothetical protein